MSNKIPTPPPGGEVVVYETPDGNVRVDVKLEQETVWLTQGQMAELFGRDRSVITRHINNAFQEGELAAEATCAKFAQVHSEGGREVAREIDHYNLTAMQLHNVFFQVRVGYSTTEKISAVRSEGEPHPEAIYDCK